jgi:hypothetical protein
VVCWGGCVERWSEMGICMQTPLLSLVLNLVLSVGKVMLPIEDLMVDGLLPPVVAMGVDICTFSFYV